MFKWSCFGKSTKLGGGWWTDERVKIDDILTFMASNIVNRKASCIAYVSEMHVVRAGPMVCQRMCTIK